MNSEKLCISLPKELKQKLLEYAKKKNISQNSVIRLALSNMLEKE